MFTLHAEVVKDRLSQTSDLRRGNVDETRVRGLRTSSASPARSRRKPRLLLEDNACSRLVGDQPVDQTALQRGPDGRGLGRTDGGSDGQGVGGNLRRNAGQARVGAALDDSTLRIERPAGEFAD